MGTKRRRRGGWFSLKEEREPGGLHSAGTAGGKVGHAGRVTCLSSNSEPCSSQVWCKVLTTNTMIPYLLV